MTPNISFYELDSLLRGDINWKITGDGLEVTNVDYKSKQFMQKRVVSPVDLNSLHPQMYATLKLLRQDVNEAMRRDDDGSLRRDHSDGRYPRAAMRHLCGPLVVQDVKGHYASLAFIWNILWENTDKRVFLQTMSYDLNADASTGQEGLVSLKRVSSQSVRVTKEWMAETYPGWDNRMQSAAVLGLIEEELVDHVCGRSGTNLSLTPPTDISPQ